LKTVDLDQLKDDIRCSVLFTDPACTADDFADQLDKTVTSILDVHCSLQTRRKFTSRRPDNRWLSLEAVKAKRTRRRLERKSRSTRNESDYIAYRRACRVANNSIVQSLRDHYSQRVRLAGRDPRKRWTAIGDILHQTEPTNTHVTANCQSMCDCFADYFVDKIKRIKSAIGI